jgi:hypothetical protein
MSWDLTGNSGTDPTINFLGTTDNQPLIIKTNALEPTLTIAPGGFVSIVHSNNDIIPSQASLTIENPTGSQSIQNFSFGGIPTASIRADSNGNLVLNASSSTYFLSRDFGAADSITLVPHDRGGTLAIAGNANIIGTLSAFNIKVGTEARVGRFGGFLGGITFADGTSQYTASIKGDTGAQGPAGPPGPQGPKGDPGSAAPISFVVCSGTPCDSACLGGVLASVTALSTGGCSVSDGHGGQCSHTESTLGFCCLCKG